MQSEGSQVSTIDYPVTMDTLIRYGVNELLAHKIIDIIKAGQISRAEIDVKMLDALKGLHVQSALNVLNEYSLINTMCISNKSDCLWRFIINCDNYEEHRSRRRNELMEPVLFLKRGAPYEQNTSTHRKFYHVVVTPSQRLYGAPPIGWRGPPPGPGTEIFCGGIPKNAYETELIPLFERFGVVYSFRLIINIQSGYNRGYAFVTLGTREAADSVVDNLRYFEVKLRLPLTIRKNVPKVKLFVGNLPKYMGRSMIMTEFGRYTSGLVNAIVETCPDHLNRNRGFCYLVYDTHEAAYAAMKYYTKKQKRMFGYKLKVAWADSKEEVENQDVVNVLHVGNLKQVTTAEDLYKSFVKYGPIEMVQKIKDYAFVHFVNVEDAVKARETLNNRKICGSLFNIRFAKRPMIKNRTDDDLLALLNFGAPN